MYYIYLKKVNKVQFSVIYLCIVHAFMYVLLKTQVWYICTTLLTYSPFNYLLIITISFIFLNIKKNKFKLLFSWFLYVIYYLLTYKKIISFFRMPVFLVMGYNSIHPYIFYFSFVLLIVFFFNQNKINYNITLRFIFLFACFGFILGSFWGWGNSIWSFFWVNDKIEQVFFYIILVTLFRIHVSSNNIVCSVFILISLVIIEHLLLIRFGFSLTRHNFFDIRQLINISFGLVIFFINFGGVGVVVIIIIFNLTFSKFYYLILLLICVKKDYIKYNFQNKFWHCLIFFFFISWLKFKEYNILYILLEKLNVCYNTLHTLNIMNTFNSLFYLKKKIIFFKFFLFSFYFFRLLIKTVYIYTFYYYSVIILSYLISRIKIYSY